MNYSNQSSHVRVDLFQPSGKWEETMMIDMARDYATFDLYSCILKHFEKEDGTYRYAGWMAVVLEPYARHSWPIIVWLPANSEREAQETGELLTRVLAPRGMRANSPSQ